MKPHLPKGFLNCIFITAVSNSTFADTSLANSADTTPLSAKVLSQVSNPPIMEDILEKQSTSPPSFSKAEIGSKKDANEITIPITPSKLTNIVKKAIYLTEGAGILGENVSTVVKKDVVGLQYTMQW